MPISVATPRSVPGLASALRDLLRRTLAQEGRKAGEIAILLTGDLELRELNRRWRGIDRATDVLSFEYGSGQLRVSGDLVISLDRVAEQAARYRVSRGRELARLVVHGALHLAGHEHHRAGERRLMRSRENRTLRASAAEVRRLDAALARRKAPEVRRSRRRETGAG